MLTQQRYKLQLVVLDLDVFDQSQLTVEEQATNIEESYHNTNNTLLFHERNRTDIRLTMFDEFVIRKVIYLTTSCFLQVLNQNFINNLV